MSSAHRRTDPLTGRHVLVSPERSQRPWQGAINMAKAVPHVAHDADCYLCAGNMRASGIINPDYSGVYVFENDFPALTRGHPSQPDRSNRLMQTEGVEGTSRVICFSPDHSATLPELSTSALGDIVDT
jgi:UDPglucose--hexose-1-phosphate uridylyltransferase